MAGTSVTAPLPPGVKTTHAKSLIDVLTSAPVVWSYLSDERKELRATCLDIRDAHDAECMTLALNGPMLLRLLGSKTYQEGETYALSSILRITGRGCRPTALQVDFHGTLSSQLMLNIVTRPAFTRVSSLTLRGNSLPLTTAQISDLCLALPALGHLRVDIRRWAQPGTPNQPTAPCDHGCQADGGESGPGNNATSNAGFLGASLGGSHSHNDSWDARCKPAEKDQNAAGDEGDDVCGIVPVLATAGLRLASLELLIGPNGSHGGPTRPAIVSSCISDADPGRLVPHVLGAVVRHCGALRELRLQFGTQAGGYGGGSAGGAWRPKGAAKRADFGLSGGDSGLAAAIKALSALTSLTALVLRGLPIGLPPGAPAQPVPLHRASVASTLLPLRALTALTRLALPLEPAATSSSSSPDDGASASGMSTASALPLPKRWHVLYGEAVRCWMRPAPTRTPPAQAAASCCVAQLVDLDLGHDLALTLPYFPYDAVALTRLCVGEVSAECVAASQWDVVPEPASALPYELLTGVPAWAVERLRRGPEAGDGGSGGEGEGGSEGGQCGSRPLCSLPVAAVRLPPRLRVLQVRYMPDVAVLAALSALPHFTSLECTAVRHPHGEICLDLASVGLPGPPDLGRAVRLPFATAAAATTGPGCSTGARAQAASCGGSGGIDGEASGGERAGTNWGGTASIRPVTQWLTEMVAAAAALLLRVLTEDDWHRHPLSLRPSPFSFTREGYDKLRWPGPHAGWITGLEPLASKVTRVRLKNLHLQQQDVPALAAALTGLHSLELVRCSARAAHLRMWQRVLAPGVMDASTLDQPPGGPCDCDDMFGSDSDGGSGSGD